MPNDNTPSTGDTNRQGESATDNPTTPAAATPAPAPAPAQAGGEAALGDVGKRALDAERAARKAAEKQLKELQAAQAAAQDAERSQADKAAAALAALEAKVRALEVERDRAAAAAKTGVPAELLAGPGDDAEAYASALKEWAASQAPTPAPAPAGGSKSPLFVLRHMGNPDGDAGASLDDQIKAAEAAGDKTLLASLKAMKLGG
ncbi:hypothetical protein CWT12_06475 [Actinomyces sp. 432]|uniref:hypothetical protein n=1 Tax=Actinomyces sp. 432 TaxID=2057798 RepID=UPI0013742582|nr:hypothetical protein [Actinomyces sp. 432]QHO91033.1 hypothetical protein CWT12_06475 [Actinomyces sp. 432]